MKSIGFRWIGGDFENAASRIAEENNLTDGVSNQTVPFLRALGQDIERLHMVIARLRENFDAMVVTGIGGSSLGAQTIRQAFCGEFPCGERQVVFLENVDPFTVRRVMDSVSGRKAVWCFVSKSGETLETVSIMNIILENVRDTGSFVFISDAGSPFQSVCDELGGTFVEIPHDVPGRFSVFTPVGLIPAGFMGVDIHSMIAGASDAASGISPEHPSVIEAVFCFVGLQAGRNISVFMPYSDRLKKFADWYTQLWAESLGKNGMGQTPLKSLGTVDQHSLLQLFLDGPDDKVYHLLKVRRVDDDIKICDSAKIADYISGRYLSEIMDAEFHGTLNSLLGKERPVAVVEVDRLSARSLGVLFMHFMLAVTFMGRLMGVNPFNQPAVELCKQIARKRLQGGELRWRK